MYVKCNAYIIIINYYQRGAVDVSLVVAALDSSFPFLQKVLQGFENVVAFCN